MVVSVNKMESTKIYNSDLLMFTTCTVIYKVCEMLNIFVQLTRYIPNVIGNPDITSHCYCMFENDTEETGYTQN